MLPFPSSYYLERIYTLGPSYKPKVWDAFEDIAERLANVRNYVAVST